MNVFGWLQVILYLALILGLAKPLGAYMARVYQDQHTFLDRILNPVERFIYRLAGIDPAQEMNWKVYAIAMLIFNLFGLLAVYALQRLQHVLPLNPQGMAAVTSDSWGIRNGESRYDEERANRDSSGIPT